MQMKMLGAIALSCLLFGLVLADECHSPDVDNVGSEPGLAADICAINSALGTSPPDFETAKAIYTKGRNSKDPTLVSIATASRDTATWAKYVDYFGADEWMDEILTEAFEGEAPFSTPVKRVQVIKKILQGTVMTQQMMWHIESAVASAEDGDADAALISWEKAMAAFYGTDVDCAPFGNGQARGIEFATMNKGVAVTNYNIAEEFGEGVEALKGDIDAKAFTSSADEIKRQVVVIYIQSVSKYAALIDQAIEKGESFEKAQGEGYGYLHAILPLLNDVNARETAKLLAVFDPSNEPSEEDAEEVSEILGGMLEALDITDAEVKSFDGSRPKRFVPPTTIACEAQNPFSGLVGVAEVDADK